MLFANREEAGNRLTECLRDYAADNPTILAIARGGIDVAAPIAEALQAPLDVITPRKIGSPTNPELAVGAVSPDGTVYFNEALLQMLGLNPDNLQKQAILEAAEAKRRGNLYHSPDLERFGGRTVILVDDGVATGYTLLATLRALKRYCPEKVVVAVPVAPRNTLALLLEDAGEVICLETPEIFYAVGQFYHDFRPTSDARVLEVLKHNRRGIRT